MITEIERIKARAYRDSPVKKKMTMSMRTKKGKKEELKNCEKDLYREVATIKRKTMKKEMLENTRKVEERILGNPPTANKVLQNKARFGNDTEDMVTEWEKNETKKLFLKYDTDNSGFLEPKEYEKLMQDLLNDECILGKIPNLTETEVEGMFDDWDKNEDGKISWKEFRNGMNRWKWRLIDMDGLESRVDSYFAEANKKKIQGKMDEAREEAYKALKLQGTLTKTKPIEVEKKKSGPSMRRGDVFNLKIHRKKENKKADMTKTY